MSCGTMRSMLTVLLLLSACKRDVPLLPSPATWEAAGDAVSVEVVGSIGPEIWVRRVDAMGGTVPGDDVEVSVDGVSRSVPVAADGFGRFSLDEPGAARLTAGETEAWGELPPTAWPGLRLREGWLAETLPQQPEGELVGAAGGLLSLDDGALWWIDRAGHHHTALAPPTPVLGMASGHLDEDGVEDAVAWTATSVHLLRGRPAGGLAHLGRITSDTREVIGAAIGDPSDDGNADIAIVWTGGTREGQLDVWEGDGQLGFSPAPNRYLADPPVSVTVGAPDSDAPDEITILTSYGTWNRFYAYRGQYARSGPALLLDLPTGSVHDVGDVLGDGGHELLMMDAWSPGALRTVRMMDLQDEARVITLDRPAARVFVEDLDGDGLDDLLFSDASGAVVWTHNVVEPQRLSTNTLVRDGYLDGGPIGATPAGDVLLAGPSFWGWFDVEVAGDGMTLVDGALDRYGAVVREGRFGVLPDGSVVGVPPTLSQLRVWRELEGVAVTAGSLSLGSDPVVLRDLAVCGTQAYVLLADRFLSVDLSDPAHPGISGERALADGVGVACGAGPRSGTVGVQVGATIRIYDDTTAEVTSQAAVDFRAFALGDGRVGTCAEEGCGVVFGPFGSEGAAVPVVAGLDGVTVDGVPIPGSGEPSVQDVDGDGRPDLVLQDAGRIVVHRHTELGFAPARLWWTRQTLVGPAWFADRDGDGIAEVWAAQDETDRVMVSVGSVGPDDPLEDTAAPRPTGDTGR